MRTGFTDTKANKRRTSKLAGSEAMPTIAVSVALQLATLACVATVGVCYKSNDCPNSCRGSSVTENDGMFGVDVSTAVSLKQFLCLKHCGYHFAITPAYDSGVLGI